jgi:hypothetical protein
LVGDKDIYKY